MGAARTKPVTVEFFQTFNTMIIDCVVAVVGMAIVRDFDDKFVVWYFPLLCLAGHLSRCWRLFAHEEGLCGQYIVKIIKPGVGKFLLKQLQSMQIRAGVAGGLKVGCQGDISDAADWKS